MPGYISGLFTPSCQCPIVPASQPMDSSHVHSPKLWFLLPHFRGTPRLCLGSISRCHTNYPQVQFAQIRANEGVPGGSVVKNPLQCRSHRRCWFNPWVRQIAWRRACNPLQYSCLENIKDRGAWWATVHRVERLRHDLKQLSSHTCRARGAHPMSFLVLKNHGLIESVAKSLTDWTRTPCTGRGFLTTEPPQGRPWSLSLLLVAHGCKN